MDVRYPFLRNLPSYKFYEQLNEDGVTSYYSYCTAILSAYPDNSDIINLCGKLIRNLKKLYTWNNKDIPPNERCSYLNYWIYFQMINNHKLHEPTSIYDSHIIIYLIYDWDRFIYTLTDNYKCVHERYRISSNEFLEKKKLHDDNKNYKSIKDIVNSGKNDQNYDYFSYITENENLHGILKEECKCTNNTKFCVEFHKYNRDNKKDKLCSLECNSEISSSVPNTKVNSVCPLPEPVLQSSLEPMSQEREGETGAFTGSMEVQDDTSSSPTSSSTLTISLLTSIIGIFPLLYISYKFTPFGPWLRRRISNKKIISDYTDNESNEKLQHSPDRMLATKNASYIIPHHSLINF
ncbi:PIR Superfamily Protein [Plasmodium ovale curtisi]|uniref:PIR Superfamily Protein n=1 Tax=Plasmodium ovale curtisi TaxID=864141 RepID=A0A1A8VNS7_PLAOA|nr:PIR Superfamily Protein [Plasmodium ovale curtisi]SBT01939.1 PIR Superfamily Protein [Plasmodium ovale curtisi]